jgi:hypothetical protein
VACKRAEVREALGKGLCLELLKELVEGGVSGEWEVFGCFGDL